MLYDLAGNTLVEYRGWQSAVQQAYATYSYGADSEKLSVADANGNLTGFGYDGFNRLTATTYPDSTAAHPDVETLAYDKDSNITARTTRAGQVLNYTFDAIDRMTKKTVPAVGAIPAVESDWAYYLNGAVKELDDFLNGSGTKNNDLTYGYDSAGRMTSTSTTIPGISGSLVTGYVLDLDGNRTQLTWPDGYFVTYAYDSLDRMTSATEGGGSALATYSYDTLSRRTNVTFQGGGNMAYVYTPAGDLTALNDTVPGTGSVPHFTLGYTPAHQLASEASSDPT
ncbi:MAG TPA: RHS repeat domain-containing protein, partial [Verrucomicrobiae bacterium]|nr:RHS repeat domain-containing protein [Verrucomicrobiae bacterium]